ncbi:hypothetical protein Glove_355g36 [Diversispora epigaea]|uniref:Uncharacterized protein n=1 Tax=Diversispora epigaea TaxID=1348612 RepID=A0A397HGG3_9GLOM|nr:hypothetical protein Glove_355g36 [Diversispora epigaea]
MDICPGCNQEYSWKVKEWIPYDRFKDVKQIEDDGDENEEDDEDNDDDDEVVVLKKFEHFVNFNDVLNEMAIHLKVNENS